MVGVQQNPEAWVPYRNNYPSPTPTDKRARGGDPGGRSRSPLVFIGPANQRICPRTTSEVAVCIGVRSVSSHCISTKSGGYLDEKVKIIDSTYNTWTKQLSENELICKDTDCILY